MAQRKPTPPYLRRHLDPQVADLAVPQTAVTLTASAVAAVTTDSTGGATTAAAAAGVGQVTLTLPAPANLSTLSTGGVDVVTGLIIPFKFKVISWEFMTTVAGTGSGASLVFNLEIGTVDVGTVASTCTVTLAGTDTIGKRTAATAVSGANTGAAGAALSLEVAGGGTAFTAGSGYFMVTIQNMDTADAFTAIIEDLAALRTGVNANIVDVAAIEDMLDSAGVST